MGSGATIRTTCPNCGDVELGVDDLTAMICSTNQAASYAFRCPSCGQAISKPTGRRVVEVLVSSGVALHTWSLPAELYEAHDGPPLCSADLARLRQDLDAPDWLSRLRLAGRAARQKGAGNGPEERS
jgi:ribosomal protein S27E